MSEEPTDKPPDQNTNDSSSSAKRMYSNVLKGDKRTFKGADVQVNLSRDFKWEVFVLLMETEDGKAYKGEFVKHVNIYDIAMLYGFKEFEIAGANPKFGIGQACIYTNYPIDVRSRIELLKKSHKIKVKNENNTIDEVTFRLKGIEGITAVKKRRMKITLVNTFKRVDETRVVNFMKQFGEVIEHYPKRNPVDKSAEEKYSKYKEIWRDSDYVVDIVADPSTLPQILPFQGNLIKLKFQGVRLQCQKCFSFGHMKHHCMDVRVKTFHYEKALKQTLLERSSSKEQPESLKICPSGNGIEMLDKNDPKTSDPVPIISLENVAQNESLEIEEVHEDNESVGRLTEEIQLRSAEETINDNQQIIVASEEGASGTFTTSDDTNSTLPSSNLNEREMTASESPMRPRKSHLDLNKIINGRTRSMSAGKRNRPDTDFSPRKGKQAKGSETS